MKVASILTTLSFASGILGAAYANAQTSPKPPQANQQTTQISFQKTNNGPMENYEAQIGYQRRIILEEKLALEQAYKNRDNSVHIGKDLRDLLAYGISSGYLTYRFLNKTDNLASLRSFLQRRKVPTDLIPTSAAPASPAEGAAAALESTATTTSRAELYQNIGTGVMRATEAISATVLGYFFICNIVDTGHDLVVKFKDTDEIKAHREALSEAERNLVVADQNLQAAVLAQNAAQ